MSRFTDDLYRHWLGQNGSYVPRRRLAGGMGAVAPMVTAAPAPALGPSRGAASANDATYSRPEKPVFRASDYVDKS